MIPTDTLPDGTTAVQATAEFLRARITLTPKVMLVLGSGMGALADEMQQAVHVPFAEVPGFPPPRVAGHRGMVVAGRLEGVDCIALQGRFHLYEGHSAPLAALPIRAMAALGARTLIVSNAAGGVNPSLAAGDLMLIDDHINFMFRNPLIGAVVGTEQRFPDMSAPYDPALQAIAQRVATEQRIALKQGVYLAVLGPSYETPAEIRMFGKLGADAVGMSTVPEVITARALGVRVLGLSLITNAAAGTTGEPLSHDEVIAAAEAARPRFTALVRGVIGELGRM